MRDLYLENGFLYYYGNRVGYQKGELAYVDTIFTTSHLKELLKKDHGLYLKEQPALYERLLHCKSVDEAGQCRVQFCRIWQWREEVGAEKKFLPYEKFLHQYGKVDLREYQVVYDGYVETDVPEAIYQKFNTRLPEGFPGHPLSLSDVLELYDEKTGSSFFYVDEFGFQKFETRWEETT